MVRVGVKIPLDGNRANWYGRLPVVHGHVWRTVCSVFVTDSVLLPPLILPIHDSIDGDATKWDTSTEASTKSISFLLNIQYTCMYYI
jgi:hypothetical protein